MNTLSLDLKRFDELTNVEFSAETMNILLNIKPPLEKLTPHQETFVSEIQELYDFIITLLKDFFSGNYTKALDDMEPKNAEFFENVRERYIRLYTWIQKKCIWKEIKSEFQTNFKRELESPGFYLTIVLLEDFGLKLEPCILNLGDKRSKFVPRKVYEKYNRDHLKRVDTETKKELGRRHLHLFSLLSIVDKASKNNTKLQNEIEEYIKLEENILDSLMKEIQPSKHVQGEQWSRGYLTILRQSKKCK